MMKKLLMAIGLSGVVGTPAFAQSSITLYGIIDAGIDYVSNSGGHSLWQMQSGLRPGNRWGLKGSEDLGGDTRTIFQLENGFNLFNGKLGQGGLEFGRQGAVGLTNPIWGTLTIGRQYDPLVDLIGPTTLNGNQGGMFSHPSDVDNTDNGIRVNNSVKYVTPKWNGFTAEGMYAFGGVVGSFGQNSTISAGASSSIGSLYLGAAYFYARNPAQQFPEANFQPNGTPGVSNGVGLFGYVGNPTNMQTIGVGVTYSLGLGQVGADFTNVKFQNASGIAGNTVTFNNYEFWGVCFLTPALSVAGGYTFTQGKVDFNGARPKYNQFNVLVDYALSKRTDVYVAGVYQRAGGGADADIYQVVVANQSSTPSQGLARIAIRHKF